MRIQSIKFKISILYTIALGLLLVAYSTFLYLTLSRGLVEDLDIGLKYKTQQIKAFIDEFHKQTFQEGDDINENLSKAVDIAINLDKFRLNEGVLRATGNNWLRSFDRLNLSQDFIYFMDLDKDVPIFTKNVSKEIKKVLEEKMNRADIDRTFLKDIDINHETYRFIQEPFYFNGRVRHLLVVATSEKELLTILRERRDTLFFSIPFVLVLAILISRYFSNRLIRPIVEVADIAEQVTHKDLSQRIETRYTDEEIKVMVAAFNKMIDRLQRSFGHVSQFNSHVAHELKTPISIINGECEVALRKDQTKEEYKESLKAIFEESKKMLKTTEDLLLLARADYTPENFVFAEFDLKEFFEEIHEKEKKAALKKKIDLALSLPPKTKVLKGDALHLRRVFLNVINNAIKFTPEGGKVGLDVKIEGANLVVDISDTGIGISPEDIENIFRQFYQKIPSVSHERGVGLGLSIAQALVKIHNGTIKVKSVINQGTIFTVSLPLVTDASQAGVGARSAAS